MIMNSRFTRLANNWYDMAPEKTDHSFYFDRNNIQNKTMATGHSTDWFRVLLYELSDNEQKKKLDGFKTKIIGNKCLLRLGIEYNGSTPFFTPFLQVSPGSPTQISDDTCFDLKAEDHISSENLRSEPLLFIGEKDDTAPVLKSFTIPPELVLELQNNWLMTSPAVTADHFKVIDWKNPKSTHSQSALPSVEVVRYYTFDIVQNLGEERIAAITKIQLSMGLNLNQQVSDRPTFAPILIFTLTTVNEDGSGENQIAVDLANPCPPTC